MGGTEHFGEKCLKTISIAAIKLGSSHLSKGRAQPSGMDHSSPSFSSHPSHYFYKTSWNKHNFYNSVKLGWKQPTKLGLKQNETPKWITNCLFFFPPHSHSYCNPFQSGWVRFMAAITPGPGEFSCLLYLSHLHSSVCTRQLDQQWGCWQVRIWFVSQLSTENKGGSGGTGTFTVTNLFSIGEWLLEKKIPTSVLRILLIDFRILLPHFMTAETFRGE